MKIGAEQLANLSERMLIQKLDGSFRKSLEEFADLPEPERIEFIEQCAEAARARGLLSEIGIASYALGAWWLDLGFEEQSPLVIRMFATDLPEVRKIHALNEWIHGRLAAPAEPSLADNALRAAFQRTTPWGTR